MGSHKKHSETKKKVGKRLVSPKKHSFGMPGEQWGGAMSLDEFNQKDSLEKKKLLRNFLDSKGYDTNLISDKRINKNIKYCSKKAEPNCLFNTIANKIVERQCANQDAEKKRLAKKLQEELINSLSGKGASTIRTTTQTPMRRMTTTASNSKSRITQLKTHPGQQHQLLMPSHTLEESGARNSQEIENVETTIKVALNSGITLLKEVSNERSKLLEEIKELSQNPSSAQNKEEITKLKKELAEKNSIIAEAKESANELKEHKEKLARLERELSKAKQELESAKQAKNTAEQTQQQQKIKELTATLSEENTKIKEQLEKIEDKQSTELTELRNKISEAEQAKQTAAKELEEVKKQLEDAKTKADNKTEINKLQKELEEAKNALKKAAEKKEEADKKFKKTKVLLQNIPSFDESDENASDVNEEIQDMDKILREEGNTLTFTDKLKKIKNILPTSTTIKNVKDILMKILENIKANLNDSQKGGNSEEYKTSENIETLRSEIKKEIKEKEKEIEDSIEENDLTFTRFELIRDRNTELLEIYNKIVNLANNKFENLNIQKISDEEKSKILDGDTENILDELINRLNNDSEKPAEKTAENPTTAKGTDGNPTDGNPTAGNPVGNHTAKGAAGNLAENLTAAENAAAAENTPENSESDETTNGAVELEWDSAGNTGTTLYQEGGSRKKRKYSFKPKKQMINKLLKRTLKK